MHDVLDSLTRMIWHAANIVTLAEFQIRYDVKVFLQVFLDLDFTLMEMNPFTLDADGKPFPLDMRGELDDTAAFKSGKK